MRALQRIGRGAAAILLPWLVACGPIIDLDHDSEAGTETTVGTTSDASSMSVTSAGSVTAGTVSDSVTSTADTHDSGDTATDDGPRLDFGTFDVGPPPPGDGPMYEACSIDAQCLEGLECVTLAFGKDLVYSICTRPCVDPLLDCDPAPLGWSPICAIDLDGGGGRPFVCAIGCDETGACPGDIWCAELLLPEGPAQLVCIP